MHAISDAQLPCQGQERGRVSVLPLNKNKVNVVMPLTNKRKCADGACVVLIRGVLSDTQDEAVTRV